MWKDGECFILGGGPSLPRQFGIPSPVIERVCSKAFDPEKYSPYLHPIHDKHVIGVNNAYQIGTWIDVMFFGDCSWYNVHRHPLAKWPGLKITCCNRFRGKHKENMEGVKYVEKNNKCTYGLTPGNPSKISWNSNSGAAAINVAVHFGVKRIILLGFDMNTDGKKTHWHRGHNPKKTPPFKRHLRGFSPIAEVAEEIGVEILNCSQESAITHFPKVALSEVL